MICEHQLPIFTLKGIHCIMQQILNHMFLLTCPKTTKCDSGKSIPISGRSPELTGNRDFAFFVFERQLHGHLRIHLVMQKLSSEATICPDTMKSQVCQRVAMLFFLCSSNQKVINRFVREAYVDNIIIP